MPHIQDPYVDEDGLIYRSCARCSRVRIWSDFGAWTSGIQCIHCAISDIEAEVEDEPRVTAT